MGVVYLVQYKTKQDETGLNVELRQPDNTRRVSPGTDKILYTSTGIRLSHIIHLEPLLLTWFIFNTRIDKYSYAQ